jgi:hypothetical protein
MARNRIAVRNVSGRSNVWIASAPFSPGTRLDQRMRKTVPAWIFLATLSLGNAKRVLVALEWENNLASNETLQFAGIKYLDRYEGAICFGATPAQIS